MSVLSLVRLARSLVHLIEPRPSPPLRAGPAPTVPAARALTQARVLTLTAPSLWRLISASDTLSPYHANGPAALARPRVSVPSALYQRAPGGQRGGQIREASDARAGLG